MKPWVGSLRSVNYRPGRHTHTHTPPVSSNIPSLFCIWLTESFEFHIYCSPTTHMHISGMLKYNKVIKLSCFWFDSFLFSAWIAVSKFILLGHLCYFLNYGLEFLVFPVSFSAALHSNVPLFEYLCLLLLVFLCWWVLSPPVRLIAPPWCAPPASLSPPSLGI